jgi:hypothetical protein
MTTYLQAVNDVLIRLREDEVSTVGENSYSKLIGKFINDSKRSVEDAFTWNALSNTLTATTSNGIFNYVLTGSTQRFKTLNVFEDSTDTFLQQRDNGWMNSRLLSNDRESGQPIFYNYNGVNSNGDTQVDLYPVPDGVYTIRFNLYIPQVPLYADADVLKVPADPVILGAYARAVSERGEDQGMASADAYGVYRQALGDAIAVEQSNFLDNSMWLPV